MDSFFNQDFEEKKDSSMPRDKFFGIYRGIVEYNADPLISGRIKVRVPNVDGPLDDVQISDLNWAWPINIFGGGYHFGSVIVPIVGASVWVMYEEGNRNNPVYLGTWSSVPNTSQTFLRADKLPTFPVSMAQATESSWTAPSGSEFPIEAQNLVEHKPEHYVLFKSVKGATFSVEDRDEAEKLSIIDRSGQSLIFESFVTNEANNNNSSQRELKNSIDNTSLDISTLIKKEATIQLSDISGQSIKIQTQENNNNISISSNNTKIEISENNIFLETGNSKIHINSETGNVLITAKSLMIQSDTTKISGDLNISGNLLVGDNLLCNGNGLFSKEVLSNKEEGYKEPVKVSTPII